MKQKKFRVFFSAVLAAAIFASSFSVPALAVKYAENDETKYGTPVKFDYNAENSYENFIKAHEGDICPASEISVKASNVSAKSSNGFLLTSYEGKNNVLFYPEGTEEWAEWEIDVPEAGLYNFSINCNLGKNAGNDLDLSLKVNGKVPYNEASNNVIRRVWADTTEIQKDSRDNEIRPQMEQKPVWIVHSWTDPEGYTEGRLKVYFNQGKNTVRLTTVGQSFYIDEIRLYQEKELKPYSQVKSEYEAKGYKPAQKSIKLQAEKNFQKTSSTIYPVADKTSPLTEPSSTAKIRLNTIGGTGWQTNGQSVTWDFDVEEAGLYNISLKYLQNITSGMFTTRKIMIDGEVPFAELEKVNFPYNDNWQIKTLGKDSGEPYQFYFDKGKHYITMEVTFGDITNILREVNSSIFTMNEYYRKIIMISGATPDTLRDYQFEKQIPDLLDAFAQVKDNLASQKQALINLSGGKSGSAVSQLDRMIYDLDYMVKKPEKISSRLSTFKNNITGLSAWVLNMANQPLKLDYLIIKAPADAEPDVEPNFIQAAKYSFDTFIASFTEDYDLISDDAGGDTKRVRVWVNLGRDQVGILKDLIVDDFTPKTNINVKLELVQGALIEATLAGRGPDVALTIGSTEPVNYAIRGALVDLSQFSDFNEVTKRFHPSAMVPFKFQNGYYALPDTQNFEMMFYRKDILSELGIGIPNTWEQFKQIVPIIKKNNMNVGWSKISTEVPNNASVAFTIFNTLMYQRGGKYYTDDLKATDLGSEAAREAFKESTDYYINYDFPQTYDFYSRFRTGDIPLAIQLYTQANLLRVGAPELKGLWGMAPLPGTVREDGTLNRAQTSAVTACVMFKAAKDKDSAWEFMKWFTSADIQAKYGIELEKVMGASARYATANRAAFMQLPWTREEQTLLNEGWEDVQGVPEVPGSYYTARGIQNAFRTTIYDYANPYETLHDWQLDIDEEIARKYKEFGLE
ncbi:MAG: extracellular solute-binding protein [Clostridia bacterium]|nr:extracellular solute-binding protein [Clostridia bacterium]